MNPEEIKVLLTVSGEDNILTFLIDDAEYPDGLNVALDNTEAQTDLKKVFSALLKKLEKSEIVLNLEVSEDYKNGLYKDVFSEYINDLNRELSLVYNRIQNELK